MEADNPILSHNKKYIYNFDSTIKDKQNKNIDQNMLVKNEENLLETM